MQAKALKIDNVRKTFGSLEILKGIDIDVEPGQFLILVGPSGCGKSTLLNMIAGLESVSDGEIHIGDRNVTYLNPKDRDIAMVFQSYALYPNMSVRKNISFGLDVRKVPKNEQEEIIDRVAKILQIEALLDRKPAQLSGGQRQRVAMGRALAREPSVFLFDEPLSNLDAKLRVEMRTEIKELHQRTGTTIVYVTHDQIEAMTLGDRIAVMRNGEVQQYGSPQQIYDNPANLFVAGFIGSPSMNFIRSDVVEHDGGFGLKMHGAAGDFVLPVREELGTKVNQTVIFGIRPEQITQQHQETASDDVFNAECRVDIVEPTGPDTLVFIRLNDTKCICRVHPGAAAQPGETMHLAFDMSKAVFFDAETEQRIA